MTVGRLRAAVAAAALAGVPSAVAWPFGGSDPLPATREIGRFVVGRPPLLAGGVGHVLLSLLFSLAGPRLARARRPALAGAVYGVVLYVVNFEAVARRWWPEIRRHGGLVQIADHVAFGVVLAVASAPGETNR